MTKEEKSKFSVEKINRIDFLVKDDKHQIIVFEEEIKKFGYDAAISRAERVLQRVHDRIDHE